MTILSGREHSCIQETKQNKTQLCNDLLDPKKKLGCPYYNESKVRYLGRASAVKIKNPWDLEEFVALGKEESICPYFTLRSLMENADIIFCPYNYLINPFIRKSMNINLTKDIVIFDEAHNIEDICRDASSINIGTDSLDVIILECQAEVKRDYSIQKIFDGLLNYCKKLQKFIMDQNVEHESAGSERVSKRWTGQELIELMKLNKVGGNDYTIFEQIAKVAIQNYNKEQETTSQDRSNLKPTDTITQATKLILEEILFGFEAINSFNTNSDYRACVVEKTRIERKGPENNRWYNAKSDIVKSNRVRTLQLLCMNSAITFKAVSGISRSVILASGTLSPTLSFQSELGTKFPHFLNANHVIGKEQVHVQCINRGPSGNEMRATFQNVNQLTFKDDLGAIILDICNSVPHGVLCFFSSYSMMQQQIDRWTVTNVWSKISDIKETFIEPQRSSDLDNFMQRYREIIQTTDSGAIMFAVYRGKVAEGIDFSNDEARCVIAIGIPYPVLKQPAVKLKYDYNNSKISKGLLSGSEWYSTQAFRALNQALGRCIRHKDDWGAVILIDARFQDKNYFQHLPKWIKNLWSKSESNNFQEDLKKFVHYHKHEKIKS